MSNEKPDFYPPDDAMPARLGRLKQAIDQATQCRRRLFPEYAAPVLVAASKSQPAARIAEAIGLGVAHFGENRVQEILAKWPALLEAHTGICLHMIGSLQTNKARDAVRYAQVIESLDRPALADALADAEVKLGVKRRYLIQVNSGLEGQKSGIEPAGLEHLLRYASEQAGLQVDGLMCVPPADQLPAPYFAQLGTLAQQHNLQQLSMGMSGDFAEAIRMGATHIRLGTALFGARH